MSDFEQRLTEALTSGAEEAPDADRLAAGARSRARTRRRTRYGVVGALAVAAIAVPVGIVALGGNDSPEDKSVATDPTDDPPAKWQTIEYEGVQVDVPGGWGKLDTSSCEFQMDRFGPPETDPCKYEGDSLNFYGSALFDPAHRPGLLREGAGWAGYVYTGDWAVYTTVSDQDTGRQILGSARVSGQKAPDLSAGWRTESYDGLSIDVPESWQRGGLSSWCLDKKVDGWVEDPDTIVAMIACMPRSGYGIRFGRGASGDDAGFTEQNGPEYPEQSWAGVAIVPDGTGKPVGFVQVVAPTQGLAELIGSSLRVD